ncbi:MAG: 1-acyl-sn-glycerol-3-phosphate acyltransferase [Candidatus Nanopelagicales bacterium]
MSSGGTLRRRAVSITGLLVAVVLGTALFLPVVALLVLVDLFRGLVRLPLARLVSFGLCWAWLEAAGVAAAVGLWLTGRAGDRASHYRLQRWWADRLMGALRITCGVTIHVEGVEALHPAPVVLLVRHASLADSLLTAWVVTQHHLQPRFVLKRELLADPCLDIVGNRLPNCFLDRQAEDSGPGLARIAELAATMDASSACVIFPEGTRANAAKRRRALARIGERDLERAERLAGLRHLLPPRPAGTRALLEGAAAVEATVVVGWHVGFDGLDNFGAVLAALARPRTPIRISFRQVEPPTNLYGPEFGRWLDDLWLELDRGVERLEEG